MSANGIVEETAATPNGVQESMDGSPTQAMERVLACHNKLLMIQEDLQEKTASFVSTYEDCRRENDLYFEYRKERLTHKQVRHEMERLQLTFNVHIQLRKAAAKSLNIALMSSAISLRANKLLNYAITQSRHALTKIKPLESCPVCNHHFLSYEELEIHLTRKHEIVPDSNHWKSLMKKRYDHLGDQSKNHAEYDPVAYKLHQKAVRICHSFNSETASKPITLKGSSPPNPSSNHESPPLPVSNGSSRRSPWRRVFETKQWQKDLHQNIIASLSRLTNLKKTSTKSSHIYWEPSDELAELLFCSVSDLRKNCLEIYSSRGYPGNGDISSLVRQEICLKVCTAAVVYILQYNLKVLGRLPLGEWMLKQSVVTFSKVVREGIRFLKEHSGNRILLETKKRGSIGYYIEDDMGIKAFEYIARTQEFWPSFGEDDFDVELRVLNLSSIGGRFIAERVFRTQISQNQPVHSIFAYLNTHVNFDFHPLQRYCAAEIVVFDPVKNETIMLELPNKVANYQLKKILNICRNKQRFRLNRSSTDAQTGMLNSWWSPSTAVIEVVMFPDPAGNYPRFRPCNSMKLCIGDVKEKNIVSNFQVGVPAGCTLRHLRQLIRDECVLCQLMQPDQSLPANTDGKLQDSSGVYALSTTTDRNPSSDSDFSEDDIEDTQNIIMENLRIDFANQSAMLNRKLDDWIAAITSSMENKLKLVNAGKEVVCELLVRQHQRFRGSDVFDKDEDGNEILIAKSELVNGSYMPEEISFLKKAMFSVSATRRGRLVNSCEWFERRAKTIQDHILVEDTRRKFGTNLLKGKFDPSRVQALFDQHGEVLDAKIIENILVNDFIYSQDQVDVVLSSMGLGSGRGGAFSVEALDRILNNSQDARGELSQRSDRKAKVSEMMHKLRSSSKCAISKYQFEEWVGYDEIAAKQFTILENPKFMHKSVKLPLIIRAQLFSMQIVKDHLMLSKVSALEEFDHRVRLHLSNVASEYSRKIALSHNLHELRKKQKEKAWTLNVAHVIELVKQPSLEQFRFVHLGREVDVEREACVSAEFNGVQSGAIDMRKNHEQNSRLLVQIEPSNGISLDRYPKEFTDLSSDDSVDLLDIDLVQESDQEEWTD